MIGAALAAALTLPLLGAPKYTWTLDGRTEFRLRAPGDTPRADHAWDLDTLLGLGLDMQYRRVEVGLRYAPRLTLLNLADAPTHDLLHNGDFFVALRLRRVVIRGEEFGSYGTRSFYTLTARSDLAGSGVQGTPGPTPPTSVQIIPRASSLVYVASTSTLRSDVTLSRRSLLTVGAGYYLAGGADDRSQQLMPLSYGPYLGAFWTYSLNRRASLMSTAGLSVTHVDSTGAANATAATDGQIVIATETWRQQWARRTRTELAAGANLARTLPMHETWRFYPTGSALVTQQFVTPPKRALLELTLAVADLVVVDRLTGVTDPRWQVTAGATWAFKKTLVRANAVHAESLDARGPNAVTITTGDVGVKRQIVRWLAVDGGMRVLKQSVHAPDTVATVAAFSGLAWTVFVGLSFGVGSAPR